MGYINYPKQMISQYIPIRSPFYPPSLTSKPKLLPELFPALRVSPQRLTLELGLTMVNFLGLTLEPNIVISMG